MPWVKGQSGNPLGPRRLSPEEQEARNALSAASPKAVATLVRLLGSDNEALQLKAAVAIVDKTVADAPPDTFEGVTDEALVTEIRRRAEARKAAKEPEESGSRPRGKQPGVGEPAGRVGAH